MNRSNGRNRMVQMVEIEWFKWEKFNGSNELELIDQMEGNKRFTWEEL